MDNVGFDHKVKKDASTADTLQLIVHTSRVYSKGSFIKEVVSQLCPKGSDKLQCMRNIFDYYCRNVRYLLDETGKEKVWTPNLTVLEQTGDCKKAATFIASALLAAGIDPIFKHVEYGGNHPYTHIYVIVGSPTDYITLDPTNNGEFNKEVKYQKGTLYYIDGRKMDLHLMGDPHNNTPSQVAWSEDIGDCLGALESDLTGITWGFGGGSHHVVPLDFEAALQHHHDVHLKHFPDHPQHNTEHTSHSLSQFQSLHKKVFPFYPTPHPVQQSVRGWGFLKKVANAVKSVEHVIQKTVEHVVAEAKKDVKAVVKDVKTLVKDAKKAMFFIQRQIMLSLIHKGHLTNEVLKFNLAKSLATAYANDPGKVQGWWEFFGGDMEALKRAIREGSGVPIRGTEYIGEPTTIAASVASVTALLVALQPILKATGAIKPGSKEEATLAAATQAGIDLNNGTPLDKMVTDAENAYQDIRSGKKDISKHFNDIGTGSVKYEGRYEGSFFSLGGFIFKSLLIILSLHINQDLKNLLGTVAVVAPFVFLVSKNYLKSWTLKNV